MVYQIRKVRGKELYSVKNAETGKVHSHETTKALAKKQVKLLQAIDHGFVPSGNLEGGRMNSTVQTMITYLKSLYPHKTLISVANEILKLTGHSMSGRGRKSIKASEIAKYVIATIGTALAIAVALFLLNREEEDDTHLPEDSLIVYARKKIEEDKMKRDEEYKKQIAERTRQIQEDRQQRGYGRKKRRLRKKKV